MALLAEFIIQEVWGGAVELAYRKWGWFGGIVAFLSPFLMIGLVAWMLVR